VEAYAVVPENILKLGRDDDTIRSMYEKTYNEKLPADTDIGTLIKKGDISKDNLISLIKNAKTTTITAISNLLAGRTPVELEEYSPEEFKTFKKYSSVRKWLNGYLEIAEAKEKTTSMNPEKLKLVQAVAAKMGRDIEDTDGIPDGAYISESMNFDDFVMDTDNDYYVIVNDMKGVRRIISIYSEDYKAQLCNRFEGIFGKPAGESSINNAIRARRAKITRKINLYVRVAGESLYTKDAHIYYDLKDGRAVQVVPEEKGEGISIVQRPLMFKDYAAMGEQIAPDLNAKTEDIKELYKLLDIRVLPFDEIETDDKGMVKNTEENLNKLDERNRYTERVKHFLVCWMIYNLMPFDTDKPGIEIDGPPGSGKTLLVKKIVGLLDPLNSKDLAALEENRENLILSLSQRLIPAFDNVSYLTRMQSDVFCQAATGITFQRRVRFTDNDMALNTVRRACILNGVGNPLSMNDIGERYASIKLRPFDSVKSLDEIVKEYELKKPLVLGAMLKIVSRTLYTMAAEKLTTKKDHRMIDFVRICRAISNVIKNGSADDLEDIYTELQDEQSTEILANDYVAQLLINCFEYLKPGQATDQMKLSELKTNLIKQHIEETGAGEKHIPDEIERELSAMTPRILGDRLAMSIKDLQKIGYKVSMIKPRSNKGQYSARFVRIKKLS
jgi:hypothetical protein